MFKQLDSDLAAKMKRRVLIIGGPNSLKTTSVVETFPRPLHIMCFPGEKGSAVIPTNHPEIKGYIWEEDEPGKATLAQQIAGIETTTVEIILGKHGPCETFAGDGLHKLASIYWNREFQALKSANEKQLADGKITESELQLRAYGNENFGATKAIMNYITKVCQSNCPTVVFTCWEGIETEDKELSGNTNRHIFADLPGKLARKVVGEFGVVLYAETGLPGPDGKMSGTWQIKKAGKVWGVGVKVEKEIAFTLPTRVPMDWARLYPLLVGVPQVVSSSTLGVKNPNV